MKTTQKIKEELIDTEKKIDKIFKEMDNKGITYEESRNHFKYAPDGISYSSGVTYREYISILNERQATLKFVLQ